MIDGKQIKASSIDKTKVNFSSPVSGTDPVIKSAMDAAIASAVSGFVSNSDFKDSVLAATNNNVNIASPGIFLTAFPSVSSSPVIGSTRLLLYGQSTGQENGIWIWQGTGSPLTRATDSDTTAKLTTGTMATVEEGLFAKKAIRLITTGAIVVGTTVTAWEIFNLTESQTEYLLQVNAVNTTAAGQLAIGAINIGFTNGVLNTKMHVRVNGVDEVCSTTSDAFYISNDSGATGLGQVVNPSFTGTTRLYVGSALGYNLTTTDIVEVSFLKY
jgi:hypothetical protein